MIFHALQRQRYLIIIVAIALAIFYRLPVFASSSLFSSSHNYAPTEIILAHDSDSQPKQTVSVLQQLDLTSQQEQEIKQIHQRYRQRMMKKRQSIARLQQQLSDMMVGTEPAQLLRAKNQQLNVLRQEMGTLRFESMLATREILTPQQRQKFRELVQNASNLN